VEVEKLGQNELLKIPRTTGALIVLGLHRYDYSITGSMTNKKSVERT
jgi:hypothetical protein